MRHRIVNEFTGLRGGLCVEVEFLRRSWLAPWRLVPTRREWFTSKKTNDRTFYNEAGEPDEEMGEILRAHARRRRIEAELETVRGSRA